MRTLIVLCAGEGMINGKPLYLNFHPDGKLLAEKAVEGIVPEGYGRIVYTVLKSADDDFEAGKKIRGCFEGRMPVEVVVLDRPTSGPAETVFETIQRAEIKGELVVRDVLNSICLSYPVTGNFAAGLDLTKTDEDILNIKTKSFIVENEQRQILDIIEKKFRSDVISVGLYGFKSTEDFLVAYRRLNDAGYPIQKLYLSHVIAFLIGYKQRIFSRVEISGYEDFGSEAAWAALQRKYAVCFVDLDALAGDAGFENLEIQMTTALKKRSHSQMSCIAYTASTCDTDMIAKAFEKVGVRCAGVLTGTPRSEKKIVINNMKDLKNAILGV